MATGTELLMLLARGALAGTIALNKRAESNQRIVARMEQVAAGDPIDEDDLAVQEARIAIKEAELAELAELRQAPKA